MVDHKNKLIFIHVPRTAGNAVCRAFPDMEFETAPARNTHTKASKIRRILGDDIWNSYTTFSVVRHPLERMMSHALWEPVLRKNRGQGYAFDYADPTPWSKRKYPIWQAAPISSFLNEPVDYILRHESLQDDLDEMLEDIGLDPVEIPLYNNNTTVSMVNFFDAGAAFEKGQWPGYLLEDMEAYGYSYAP